MSSKIAHVVGLLDRTLQFCLPESYRSSSNLTHASSRSPTKSSRSPSISFLFHSGHLRGRETTPSAMVGHQKQAFEHRRRMDHSNSRKKKMLIGRIKLLWPISNHQRLIVWYWLVKGPAWTPRMIFSAKFCPHLGFLIHFSPIRFVCPSSVCRFILDHFLSSV